MPSIPETVLVWINVDTRLSERPDRSAADGKKKKQF
jgi:hypothetical protein